MATTRDARDNRRPRLTQVSVEVRAIPATMATDELRRRARELERLIVLAACRRAARLTTPAVPVDDAATAAGG